MTLLDNIMLFVSDNIITILAILTPLLFVSFYISLNNAYKRGDI